MKIVKNKNKNQIKNREHVINTSGYEIIKEEIRKIQKDLGFNGDFLNKLDEGSSETKTKQINLNEIFLLESPFGPEMDPDVGPEDDTRFAKGKKSLERGLGINNPKPNVSSPDVSSGEQGRSSAIDDLFGDDEDELGGNEIGGQQNEPRQRFAGIEPDKDLPDPEKNEPTWPGDPFPNANPDDVQAVEDYAFSEGELRELTTKLKREGYNMYNGMVTKSVIELRNKQGEAQGLVDKFTEVVMKQIAGVALTPEIVKDIISKSMVNALIHVNKAAAEEGVKDGFNVQG